MADLEAAELFTEVFYTERQAEPGVDYFLKGYVDEFLYKGKIISYGLSVYGPALWFLGLPAGHTTNSLSVSLELVRASDNEVLWRSETVRDERSVTMGLYYNWGKEFDAYPRMMQEAVTSWISEVSALLRSQPAQHQ